MDLNDMNGDLYVDSSEESSNLSADVENIPEDDEPWNLDTHVMHIDAADDEGNASDMENIVEFNKPLSVTILDLDPLICQNDGCSHRLKVPIRQCLSGHLFCSDCHQGHINCMLCAEKALFPAPSVDAILNIILDVCPYCDEKVPFHEIDGHVAKSCELSHLKCPIPQCFDEFVNRIKLRRHLTEFHGTNVDYFKSGVPAHFVFEMHSETRILIEKKTKYVFVVHYEVGPGETLFKFFCVNFFDDPQCTYRIMDQLSVAALLDESPVPITTLRDGVGAVVLGGSLLHQLRTGDYNHLHCNFVVTVHA